MRWNWLLAPSFVLSGCGAELPTAAEPPTDAADGADAAAAEVDPSAYRVSSDPLGDPLADPLLRRALEPLLDLETALQGPPGGRPDAQALVELLDARAAEQPDDHDAAIARAVLELTLADRAQVGRAAEPRIR